MPDSLGLAFLLGLPCADVQLQASFVSPLFKLWNQLAIAHAHGQDLDFFTLVGALGDCGHGRDKGVVVIHRIGVLAMRRLHSRQPKPGPPPRLETLSGLLPGSQNRQRQVSASYHCRNPPCGPPESRPWYGSTWGSSFSTKTGGTRSTSPFIDNTVPKIPSRADS